MELRLGDVAEVFNGKTPSVSEQRTDGHPVLKIRDVTEDGNFSGSFNSFVDVELAQRFRDKWLRLDDTLILNAAHNSDYVGSKSYLAEASVAGAMPTGEWLVVRPSTTKANKRYIHYWLVSQGTRRQIKDRVKGIHLYPRDVADLQISLPPVDEQCLIASTLDKANDINKKRREVIALTDEYLRSVFLNMFGGLLSGPTNQWRALSDCTDFIDYRGKTPEKSDDGIRLITAKNVRDGVINIEPAEFISEATYSWWMSRGYPQSGDVLFTTEAPLGNIAVLRTDGPVAIGQRLIAIRPREMLRSDYLSWALRQNVIQRDIFSRATGSTVKGIRSAELVQVRVPIPSYDNQLKFERIVASVNHQKEVMHASAVQGEQLYQALKQQAFQGQL